MAEDHGNNGLHEGELKVYQSTEIAKDQSSPLPPEPQVVTAFQADTITIDPPPVSLDPIPEDSGQADDPPAVVVDPVVSIDVPSAVNPPVVPTPPVAVDPVVAPPLPPTPVDVKPAPPLPTPNPVPTPTPIAPPAPVGNTPVPAPVAKTPAPVAPKPAPKPPAAPVHKPTVTAKPPVHKPAPKPAPKLGHNYNITSLADPHVTAADGRHFDNSKVGKFVLAESQSGDLKVETNNAHIKGDSGVWQTAVAVQSGNNVIKYDAQSNTINLNGKNIPFKPGETIKLPGGGSITTSNDVINGSPLHRVQVHTDKGDTLSFLNFQRPSGSRYIDVALNISAKRSVGEISGIGGVVGKNELATRDGKTTTDVGKLAESWRVNKSDNLFSTSGGVSRLHQAAGVEPPPHKPATVHHSVPAKPAAHTHAPGHPAHPAAPAHVAAPAHAEAPVHRPAPKPAPVRTPTAPLHHPLRH